MDIKNLGREDRDKAAYRNNTTDDGIDRRVADLDAHDKLDTIAGALGVSNTTATIFNITIASSGVEQSQALPASTKRFIIRTRGNSKLQLAYTVSDSGTNFITIPGGASYEDQNLYTAQTLYFQSTKVGEIVELIAFT